MVLCFQALYEGKADLYQALDDSDISLDSGISSAAALKHGIRNPETETESRKRKRKRKRKQKRKRNTESNINENNLFRDR